MDKKASKPGAQASTKQGLLLARFNEDDFKKARDNLLQRYTNFYGLLISKDQSSILSPDDVDTFKEYAAEFENRKAYSEHDDEQLKILTVLIYNMVTAQKGLAPITGKNSLNSFWSQYGHFYILRKIYHNSENLKYSDITKLLNYQNELHELYQRSKQLTHNDAESTTLETIDKELFVIEYSAEKYTAKQVEISDEYISKQKKKEIQTQKQHSSRKLILSDQEKNTLLETAVSIKLSCGVRVSAASYIGVRRKANEDGIVILPDSDQVVVIDGMGSYGNGATARRIISDSIVKFPGSIDLATSYTQKQYDVQKIGPGGVCLMSLQIDFIDDEYEINIGQAGDVRVLIFDENYDLQYESVDEAIGHKVINAIMSESITLKHRKNGWTSFGVLTHSKVTVKKGWRAINFSDGIANHLNADELQPLVTNCTHKTAIGRLSSRLQKMMEPEKAYKDNCSITILDF